MHSNRILLAALTLVTAVAAGQSLGPRDINALPETTPTRVERYGPGNLQFGELRLPEGSGPFPVAVIIHGGCWTRGFATLRNTSPIASALAGKGLATWNIEYRQSGDSGGGWPGTFLDWGAGVDHLRQLGKTYPVDLSRVFVVGHSAGAPAALWAAARARASSSERDEVAVDDPLRVQAAFAIDGPVDLAAFVGPDAEICGKPVLAAFMGGTPEERPERYARASPAQLPSTGARQFLVASEVLQPTEAVEYAKNAKAKGARVQILYVDTGHFEVIAPGRDEWKSVEALILANTTGTTTATGRSNIK